MAITFHDAYLLVGSLGPAGKPGFWQLPKPQRPDDSGFGTLMAYAGQYIGPIPTNNPFTLYDTVFGIIISVAIDRGTVQ